jgi:lipopolysaccharide export system protein LptA
MIAAILITLLAQTPAAPATKVSPKSFAQKVEVQSDRLELQGKSNQAVWVGHVRAKRGDTALSCDRLIAHYTQDQQISRIECVGSVEIVDGNRWAKGERADFDNVKGVLVVTGAPEACQGPNYMKGTKVTFHMDKDLVEVQDPKVIIHPEQGAASGAPCGPQPAKAK